MIAFIKGLPLANLTLFSEWSQTQGYTGSMNGTWTCFYFDGTKLGEYGIGSRS